MNIHVPSKKRIPRRAFGGPTVLFFGFGFGAGRVLLDALDTVSSAAPVGVPDWLAESISVPPPDPISAAALRRRPSRISIAICDLSVRLRTALQLAYRTCNGAKSRIQAQWDRYRTLMDLATDETVAGAVLETTISSISAETASAAI